MADVEGRAATFTTWNLTAAAARATRILPMASPQERIKLVGELVTAAARLDGGATAMRVTARADGPRAILSIESSSFRGEDAFAIGSSDPSARIVQGMARQMRSALTHEAVEGRYTIEFPLAPPAGQ